MPLPKNMVKASYIESEVSDYRGNPFIEALPPIMKIEQVKKGLIGKVKFNPSDIHADRRIRAHIIPSLLDDFFQPLGAHRALEEKLSIMIRRGYVGRNLKDGSYNTHMQNGYERIMSGDLDSFRFDHAISTASSLLLLGCSGSGKSTTLRRILSTYPQVIFHEEYNFTQVTYLKIDCPHDGSTRNLCVHFFRALDQVLETNYEAKYVKARYNSQMLLNQMPQVANRHGLGVLIIDEIQHLSRRKSGGIDKMLSFFVTMVNTIGLPVVFVGTPKARPIFENDLRSARRGAGFGALLWEPMENSTPTWKAFTDVLWRYQWLQNRDEILTDEVRDCWYDLSQGVHDIVVKLFVLAQLRAIATRTERITPKLLRKVYDDEFQPVKPMLAALRSKDSERIAQFSDLTLPGIDKKILELSSMIEGLATKEDSPHAIYGDNEQAQRLHTLLISMGCEVSRITPLVKKAFVQSPELSVRELIPIVLDWYESVGLKSEKSMPRRSRSVPQKDWNTLETDDLRFIYSQTDEGDMYNQLKSHSLIFDVDSLLQ